jgi:hypothetical protein
MAESNGKDKKKPPEWHLFDRLDDVEGITLELMDKIKSTETTKNIADDAYGIAITALVYANAINLLVFESGIKDTANKVRAMLSMMNVSKRSIDFVDKIISADVGSNR